MPWSLQIILTDEIPALSGNEIIPLTFSFPCPHYLSSMYCQEEL